MRNTWELERIVHLGRSKDLTLKQERFAQHVALTDNKSEALRLSHDCKGMTDKSINEVACRLAKHLKVASRIDEIRSPAVQEAIANIQERKELLSKAVRKGLSNGKLTPKDGLRAVDILNHMDGLYVTKTESKNAVIVKLIIEEEDPRDVIEGEIRTTEPS